jgi:hypothetical protein
MRRADIVGNPTLLKVWETKQAKRKARREARGPTPRGKEGASVKKVFEEVLSGMRKEAEAGLTKHYTILAEEAKAVDGVGWREGYNTLRKRRGLPWGNSYYDTPDTKFQESLLEIAFGHPQLLKMRPAEGVKKLINTQVAGDISAMFDSFIAKQTEKVNGILKGRKVHVKSQVYRNLEGTFQFQLEDGAKFLMKTQIIWKMSPKGKRFWQFPTTFHNAVKANGTAIRNPSEANLKKEL